MQLNTALDMCRREQDARNVLTAKYNLLREAVGSVVNWLDHLLDEYVLVCDVMIRLESALDSTSEVNPKTYWCEDCHEEKTGGTILCDECMEKLKAEARIAKAALDNTDKGECGECKSLKGDIQAILDDIISPATGIAYKTNQMTDMALIRMHTICQRALGEKGEHGCHS
jgi:hypothetical protein